MLAEGGGDLKAELDEGDTKIPASGQAGHCGVEEVAWERLPAFPAPWLLGPWVARWPFLHGAICNGSLETSFHGNASAWGKLSFLPSRKNKQREPSQLKGLRGDVGYISVVLGAFPFGSRFPGSALPGR